MRFGIHSARWGSSKRSLERLRQVGCECLQWFAGNPTGWKPAKLDLEDARLAQLLMKEYDIGPLVFHTAYLINLASAKEEFYEKSILLLKDTLARAAAYGTPYVVTHIGSHGGSGIEEGHARTIAGLQRLQKEWPDGVMLLLENSAGAGNAVGTSLEEIGLLLKAMPDSEQWLGLCFDTAHAYGAGYDLRSAEAVGSVVDLIDAQIGLGRLRVIHGNDTDVELGSKVDRHQNLGQGNIGWDGFTAIISEPRLSHVAFILETPDVNTEADAENMKRLKAIRESNA
ncbi:MAG: deoxyribonuclease IV [Bacillota bacterium]